MKSSLRARRRNLLLLCVLLIIIAGWFWPKKVSPESYSYYSSLLCLIVGNPQNTPNGNLPTVMKKTVAQSDSDYALTKTKYDDAAADAVIKHWKTLSSEQQQQARQDSTVCRQLMNSGN